MRRIIFTLAFLLVAAIFNESIAQTEEPNSQETLVEYIYDAAGNRSMRSIQVRSMSAPPDETAEGKPEDEELVDERSSEVVLSSQIKVYPNPTFGLLNIELNSETEGKAKVFVYDMSGKQLLKESMNSSALRQVDISHLLKGEYLLEIQIGKQSNTWNILKQ